MLFSEHSVCKKHELAEGQMREVTIGSAKILLVRVGDVFHAVTGVCPHYGGPLTEGVFHAGHVRCPWHQACFDVTNGDLLQPPAMESLMHYDVRVEGDDVMVRMPTSPASPGSPQYRIPDAMPTEAIAENRTFVILGAGAAGAMAAQTLREPQVGYRGRIVLISAENDLPYDRPALSKNLLSGDPLDHPLPLQGQAVYDRLRIDRRTARVTGVDAGLKTIHFADGSTLAFDALLLATGGTPRTLDVPGSDLPGVFTLRTLHDAQVVIKAAEKSRRAVVVGSGFIGMEAAASLTQRGIKVTVVTRESVPFERSLGEPIGRMFQTLHEQKGVAFFLGAKVDHIDGKSGVNAVVLDDGRRIDADLVLAGLGVRPATDYLKGFPLAGDGSIEVDSFLRVVPGTYAAGDIARYPDWRNGEKIRVEHWRLAQQHGRCAAFNMAGHPTRFEQVPYFWSFQFGIGLDYVGHASKWDAIHVDGDPSRQDFTAYYLRGDQVLAAAGCGRSQQMGALAELMQNGRSPSARDVQMASPDFRTLLATV